jgi:hypothetical protein
LGDEIGERYLEEYCSSISVLLKALNSNAVKTLLAFAVFFYVPRVLAIFGETAVGLDVCQIRVACTAVLA